MTISHTADSTQELVLGMPAGESKSWNWHPDIPIKTPHCLSFHQIQSLLLGGMQVPGYP